MAFSTAGHADLTWMLYFPSTNQDTKKKNSNKTPITTVRNTTNPSKDTPITNHIIRRTNKNTVGTPN